MTVDDFLRDCGLPRSEARMLLQKVCRRDRVFFIAHGDFAPSDEQSLRLLELARRRRNGEPMAYLTGRREFYGRPFKVSPDVLIPRPETELLVEVALASLPAAGVRAWDMGCGSGVLAISLKAERPDWQLWASDISPSALDIARENAGRLGVEIKFMRGDWFDIDPEFAPPAPASLDLIIANPPYIAAGDPHLSRGDLRFEPHFALTDFGDGLAAARRIIEGAGDFLRDGGFLWLEHGCDQGAEIRRLLRAHGFADVRTLRDPAGLERVGGGIFRQPEKA